MMLYKCRRCPTESKSYELLGYYCRKCYPEVDAIRQRRAWLHRLNYSPLTDWEREEVLDKVRELYLTAKERT